MAEKPFRVLLDLTNLHIDSFKYVWVSVSPRELKTIAEFKSSLLHKINLETQNIKLFVRDGLLLDEETIVVLREDDTVKVQYEEQNNSSQEQNYPQKRHKKSKKRDLTNTDHNAEDIPLSAKGHKRSDDTLADDAGENYLENEGHKTKKRCKKSKNSTFLLELNNSETVEDSQNFVTVNHRKRSVGNDMNINVLENSGSFVSFETQDNKIDTYKNNSACEVDLDKNPSCSADSLLSNKALNIDDILNLTKPKANLDFAEKVVLPNTWPKKKRKRRKKPKKEPEPITSNADIDNEFKSFIEDIPNKSNKSKHIIYTDSSPYIQALNKDTTGLINLEDSDDNNKHVLKNSFSYVSEAVSNMIHKSADSYQKISTSAQSNGCIDPNWQVSLMQNEKSNLANKNTLSSNKGESRDRFKNKNSSKEVSSEGNFHKSRYINFPPLNSMPAVGTCIAYKILELNKDYSPEVSEYKEGRINSIDPESEEMEIELLCSEIRPGRIGKFENLEEDEVPPPEIKTKDLVKWSSLIEPKLIPNPS